MTVTSERHAHAEKQEEQAPAIVCTFISVRKKNLSSRKNLFSSEWKVMERCCG